VALHWRGFIRPAAGRGWFDTASSVTLSLAFAGQGFVRCTKTISATTTDLQINSANGYQLSEQDWIDQGYRFTSTVTLAPGDSIDVYYLQDKETWGGLTAKVVSGSTQTNALAAAGPVLGCGLFDTGTQPPKKSWKHVQDMQVVVDAGQASQATLSIPLVNPAVGKHDGFGWEWRQDNTDDPGYLALWDGGVEQFTIRRGRLIRVRAGYADADNTPLFTDAFSDLDGTLLQNHTAHGMAWSKHTSYSGGSAEVSATGRIFAATVTALYTNNLYLPSADYEVRADFVPRTSTTDQTGLVGRCSTSADTMYMLRYHGGLGSWDLLKFVAGTATTLGSYSQSLTVDQAYAIRLRMVGQTISAFVDGVERITATDSAITTAGVAGVRFAGGAGTDTTGQHLDNFQVWAVAGDQQETIITGILQDIPKPKDGKAQVRVIGFEHRLIEARNRLEPDPVSYMTFGYRKITGISEPVYGVTAYDFWTIENAVADSAYRSGIDASRLRQPLKIRQSDGSYTTVNFSGTSVAKGTWSSSGVVLYGPAAACGDGITTVAAWHTDSGVPGAYVQVDLGVGMLVDTCSIWKTSASAYAGVYKVRYSGDGATWTDVATGINPTGSGANTVTFAAVSARYWRIELTNTPGGGDSLSEVQFNLVGSNFLKFRARSVAGTPLTLEHAIHYGNVGTLFTEVKPLDDPYLFTPESRDDSWSRVMEIADRYGYDARFDAVGDFVLASRANAAYAYDTGIGDSVQASTRKTRPSAYKGTYIEWAVAPTITKQVRGARIDVSLPRGAGLGSWASITVTRASTGATVGTRTAVDVATGVTSDVYYYDYRSSTSGANATILTLYVGDFDTYNVTFVGTGATTRRLDTLFVYHKDPLGIVSSEGPAWSGVAYALTTAENALTVDAQDAGDDMRNSVLVVGQRKATVTDSEKFKTNPNNPDPEFIVELAVDAASISDPTAKNYVGMRREAVIIDPKITDQDYAAYLARTAVYRYRTPRPPADITHTLIAELNQRVCLSVAEVTYQSVRATTNLWVTGYTHTVGVDGHFETAIRTAAWPEFPSYEPRADIDIDADFGSSPIANVEVRYTGCSNMAQVNLSDTGVVKDSVDMEDIVSVAGVAVSAASPPDPEFLSLSTSPWPPVPGTLSIFPSAGGFTGGVIEDYGPYEWNGALPKTSFRLQGTAKQLYSVSVLLFNGTEVWTKLPYFTGTLGPDGEENWQVTYTVNATPDKIVQISTSGTATSGTATSITNGGANFPGLGVTATNWTVRITAGTGAGQVRTVAGLTGISTIRVTTPWNVTPDSTSVYTVALGEVTYDDEENLLTVRVNPIPGTFISTKIRVNYDKYASRFGRKARTNSPYHHFVNIDHRDANRKVYLPWQQGDGTSVYKRETAVTGYDVKYRKLGLVDSAGTYVSTYGNGSPFYDVTTSELGYLASLSFDALVSGQFRISVCSVYDNTVVAYLTEPTADPKEPEAHWQYLTAGSARSFNWDGVDQVGAWNRRQSEEYASLSQGWFEDEEKQVIGAGWYVWNREREGGGWARLALIADERDSNTGVPVYGQGTYAAWYFKVECRNDTLGAVWELESSKNDLKKQLPRVVKTLRPGVADIVPTYTTNNVVQVSDVFAGSPGTLLSAHSPETGGSWFKNFLQGAGDDLEISSANRLRRNASNTTRCAYYNSAPLNSDYSVQAVVRRIDAINMNVGVTARGATTLVDTYYWFCHVGSTNTWELIRQVAGTQTVLGTYASAMSIGQDYTMRLDVVGSSIRAFIDGVERITATDSVLVSGVAGVCFSAASGGSSSDTTTIHMDNFQVTRLTVSAVVYTHMPKPTQLELEVADWIDTVGFDPSNAEHLSNEAHWQAPWYDRNLALAGPITRDTFTDTDNVLLSAHTADDGSTWTSHPSSTGTVQISNQNRIHNSGVTVGVYYSSGVPVSADYSVACTLHAKDATGITGVLGRMDTSATTFYAARYSYSTVKWELYKFVAGTATLLGDFAQTISIGVDYALRLEMRGTSIKLFVDGAERVAATDSAITAVGRPGVRFLSATGTDTTGLHLDNFHATNANTYEGLLGNQKPVRLRVRAVPRAGALWTGREGDQAVKLTRHVHLKALVHDQFVVGEGSVWPNTTTEQRSVYTRRLHNDDHTVTFVDQGWRAARTLKNSTTSGSTEWVFRPQDFKKNFRGIENEPLQFGDYLQLDEVPKWEQHRTVASAHSRLNLAFAAYVFYCSVYGVDRSGRRVWAVNRSFMDQSKIPNNAYAHWWDPASVTTPFAYSTSSTFKADLVLNPVRHQRRSVVCRQWTDDPTIVLTTPERTWITDQTTRYGLTALGVKFLRHRWQDHEVTSSTLNGTAWDVLDTDNYSAWSLASARAQLPVGFTALTRALGPGGTATPTTRLGNNVAGDHSWTWESDPCWVPCVTRDWHPYFYVPPMPDAVDEAGLLAASIVANRYAIVDFRQRTNAPAGGFNGRDVAASPTWFSWARDNSRAYDSATSGKVRFDMSLGSPAKKTDPGTATALKTGVGGVEADSLDYVRQDDTLHFEDLRGLFSRGPRPGELVKKITAIRPYYINQFSYDQMLVRPARFQGTGVELPNYAVRVAEWFRIGFRSEYLWESSTLFPVKLRGQERIDAVNAWQARFIGRESALGSQEVLYDPGAWVGWKDDSFTSFYQSNVFEMGYMLFDIGPRRGSTTELYFHMTLINERRKVPV
jgi:hypothetical protein